MIKVALLSPIAWSTPPARYGPWEQVVSNIAEGLSGHDVDVTLFATGNSVTRGKLRFVADDGYAENPGKDPKVWECLHISQVMEQAGQFDVIHNHFDFLPLTYSRLIPTPMVTTIHGFSSPAIVPVYKKYNADNFYVSISHADRHPELDYLATVHNGLHTADFTFRQSPGDYLLFFGRIHPEKGTLEAIEIAKLAGKPIVVCGLIQDEAYFQQKILPLVNGKDVVFRENAGPRERDQLLGEALALLHPIRFREPFGLSVAEAMMCGTPVIAFNLGAMPELIVNGKTGFLVHTVEEAAAAVGHLHSLRRVDCREWAVAHFSRETMASKYLRVYGQILGR